MQKIYIVGIWILETFPQSTRFFHRERTIPRAIGWRRLRRTSTEYCHAFMSFEGGPPPTSVLLATDEECVCQWWVSSMPIIFPDFANLAGASGVHPDGNLQPDTDLFQRNDATGSQWQANETNVPYVPTEDLDGSYYWGCNQGVVGENNDQSIFTGNIDLSAASQFTDTLQPPRHSIAVPYEYQNYVDTQLDNRFHGFVDVVGVMLDKKFNAYKEEFSRPQPMATSSDWHPHGAHRSPSTHEVVELSSSSGSQHVTPSLGKRESKPSQYHGSPWTEVYGKKKSEMNNESDLEYQLKHNLFAKYNTIQYLPRWKLEYDWWYRMLSEAHSGYYENT
ncbi:hypothetical protein OSB04_011687, partial [Centaurea solstitialis]